MRADDDWTDDRLAILKTMWADGATASAIAERLGLSRSAVLGMIFRLRRRAAKKEQPEADASGALKRRRRSRPSRRGTRPKKSRRRGISLLELTNETCRFPHGEPGARGFFFCGMLGADLEGGRPYCDCHARIAYSSAAISAEDDDEAIVAVRPSPSIAPFDSRRHYVWRAPVRHPAARWR